MAAPRIVREHPLVEDDPGATCHPRRPSTSGAARLVGSGRATPGKLTPSALFPRVETMFGIGMPELIVILVIALIVLGPKRLPEVARSLGKAMSEFRRQSSEIMEEFQAQGRLEDDLERRRAVKAPPAPRRRARP